MKRKNIKIILVLLMLLGIAISILNFLPTKLEAAGAWGSWEYYEQGGWKCTGAGDECQLGLAVPK